MCYWDVRIIVSEDDRREHFGSGCTGGHWITPQPRGGWVLIGLNLVVWDASDPVIADFRRRVAALAAKGRSFDYARLSCDGSVVAHHILCGHPGARLERADFDW